MFLLVAFDYYMFIVLMKISNSLFLVSYLNVCTDIEVYIYNR